MPIISFPPFGSDEKERFEEFMDSLPDFDELNADELNTYRAQVEAAIRELDGREPKNENSEAYDLWAEQHEDLEDVLDEILDRLEDLDN